MLVLGAAKAVVDEFMKNLVLLRQPYHYADTHTSDEDEGCHIK